MHDDLLAFHSQYYDHLRALPDGEHWAGINRQFANTQIIRARFDDRFGWIDSW